MGWRPLCREQFQWAAWCPTPVRPGFLPGLASGFLQHPASAVPGYFVILKQTIWNTGWWIYRLKNLLGFWVGFFCFVFFWGGGSLGLFLSLFKSLLTMENFEENKILSVLEHQSSNLLPFISPKIFILCCQQKLEGDKLVLLQLNAKVYICLLLNC